ncbi:hypothetical protein [Methylobrevis pamukkalensis]|uniref:Uncharacterized protein n=1 Tax=Methylobrevis pamukkalensis TaxID=1439726 RepID=A0A1E3H670_9HYPH|nr:hypothetical protein [Methylobrevis pamukkalensis]ODN71011.1 hypothetical protein A6302_01645 [Methylobrevis pamukkalensis]
MLQEDKILYPETGARRNAGSLNPNSVAQHLLVHAVRQKLERKAGQADNRRFPQFRERLLEEVKASGAETVLISSELIALSPETEKKTFLRYFKEFPDADIRVIYAMRYFPDYAESMLNQRLKSKGPLVDTTKNIQPLNMLRDLEDWGKLLGKDKVHGLYFSAADYKGYVGEILDAAGIRSGTAEEAAAISDNTSLSLNGMALNTALGTMLDAHGVTLDSEERRRLIAVLNRTEAEWTAKQKLVLLPSETSDSLAALFRSKMPEIANLLTPASVARMEAEMARREAQVFADSNAGKPATFTAADVAKILMLAFEYPIIRSILRRCHKEDVLADKERATAE